MTDIFAKLAAPFKPSDIDWRVGSTNAEKTKGMALAYIDARVVMDRLDAAVGPSGWACRYYIAEGKTVCELSLKCDGEWVTKSDGAGNSDFEAEKGALSDAFKRAAVRWGIGRYLYDIASPWVPIESRGKTHFITDEGRRTLNRILKGGAAELDHSDRDDPFPNNKPTHQDAPPKSRLEQWGEDSIAAVGEFSTMLGLDGWIARNQAPIGDLEKKHPETGKQLRMAIATASERLGKFKKAAAAE